MENFFIVLKDLSRIARKQAIKELKIAGFKWGDKDRFKDNKASHPWKFIAVRVDKKKIHYCHDTAYVQLSLLRPCDWSKFRQILIEVRSLDVVIPSREPQLEPEDEVFVGVNKLTRGFGCYKISCIEFSRYKLDEAIKFLEENTEIEYITIRSHKVTLEKLKEIKNWIEGTC